MDFIAVKTDPFKSMNMPSQDKLQEKTRKAAEDFESHFLTTFLDFMTTQIEPNPIFGGGKGEKMFRGILNQEVAKQMAASGGVGIADSVYQEMLRLQGDIK